MSLVCRTCSSSQIGPGIVYMTFESVFGNGAFMHTIVPLEPMLQKITHQIYFHWAVPTIVAKFYMLSEALQVSHIPRVAPSLFLRISCLVF